MSTYSETPQKFQHLQLKQDIENSLQFQEQDRSNSQQKYHNKVWLQYSQPNINSLNNSQNDSHQYIQRTNSEYVQIDSNIFRDSNRHQGNILVDLQNIKKQTKPKSQLSLICSKNMIQELDSLAYQIKDENNQTSKTVNAPIENSNLASAFETVDAQKKEALQMISQLQITEQQKLQIIEKLSQITCNNNKNHEHGQDLIPKSIYEERDLIFHKRKFVQNQISQKRISKKQTKQIRESTCAACLIM